MEEVRLLVETSWDLPDRCVEASTCVLVETVLPPAITASDKLMIGTKSEDGSLIEGCLWERDARCARLEVLLWLDFGTKGSFSVLSISPSSLRKKAMHPQYLPPTNMPTTKQTTATAPKEENMAMTENCNSSYTTKVTRE